MLRAAHPGHRRARGPSGPPPAGSAPPAVAGAPKASRKPRRHLGRCLQASSGEGLDSPSELGIKATDPERGDIDIGLEWTGPSAPPTSRNRTDTGNGTGEGAGSSHGSMPLRDAIDRVQTDEGTPEDARILTQAARRSERLRKVVEGLKSKQRTDLLTGVGSDRALARNVGWEKAPVVLFDLAGVKEANNDPKRGYKWTDDHIFKPAGRVFRAFGDDRIYRRGGTADEFPLIGKPGQSLDDLRIAWPRCSPSNWIGSAIEHRFAPGNNFSEAEVGMAAAKDAGRIRKVSSPGRSRRLSRTSNPTSSRVRNRSLPFPASRKSI